MKNVHNFEYVINMSFKNSIISFTKVHLSHKLNSKANQKTELIKTEFN